MVTNPWRHEQPYGEPDTDGFTLGSVRISRRALRTMIEQAALHTPGVVGLARQTRAVAFGRPIPWDGMGLTVQGHQVAIDLHLIARREYNLAQVGAQAQEAVAASVEQLLGMRVSEINIYIREVL